MARLNTLLDSGDDLPELSTLFRKTTVSERQQQIQPSRANKNNRPPERCIPSFTYKKLPSEGVFAQENATRKQRSLKFAHADSLLLPLSIGHGAPPDKGYRFHDNLRSNPRKAFKSPSEREKIFPSLSDTSDLEQALSDHVSDSNVSDSESDDSFEDCTSQRPVSPVRYKRQNGFTCDPAKFPLPGNPRERNREGISSSTSKEDLAISGMKGERALNENPVTGSNLGDREGSFEEPGSILKFSPPRFRSPSKIPPVYRPVTPPASPTKSKLLSPTKRVHIPKSPHRPSLDTFWSQEVINDWNDQYSPNKTPKSIYSEKIYPLDEENDDDLSSCKTGRRSPSKSPVKRDREAAEKRKVFNEKKYNLAASFSKELDETIANGQIATLAESTGGVRLVWSKKLQSTAGRANWKREAIRSSNSDGTVTATKYRHHAFIELAEKVIDDEDRLINVIAHEYCHLFNFMISNVKDQPHGKEFKVWARKCSIAFSHRGVNVTTKHSYEISYKYVWACTSTHCGTEYTRHSKSIDPTRQSCGKCKEKLVQVKPVPRAEGKGMSEYQRFVKERFTTVKRERAKLGMGEIMAVLGKDFREMKEKRKEAVLIVEEKEVNDKDQDEEKDAGFDAVVRKLDVLNLGSG